MKRLIYISVLFIFACTSKNNEATIGFDKTAPTEAKKSTLDEPTETEVFDSTLAQKYGADQYGMKPYVMAFLKTGPNRPKDSTHAVELQAAHMGNIGRLADEGKLVVAGPFYGETKGDFRGIYIFDTASIDSAKAYTESDPAIKYGSLKMELINWYGSAALIGVNEVHSKIAEVEI